MSGAERSGRPEYDPDRHVDHESEQAYLRHARTALVDMVERAERVLAFSEQRVRDEQSVDAELARAHMTARRHAVDIGNTTLCFGRIDEDPTMSDGDHWYVGRRHIEDADGSAVVVDWRAPVAVPFYRATAADPFGLARRRRFSCEVDELIAIFDEQLDDPESVSAAGIPDPVLAEIERGRSGEMADIVATIAAEQDEIIRAPLDECLLVQGGPGTGKTAVGLHRAAFLLFEHRHELSRSKVLVIGPNRVFLRYVANVLPSLGETAVQQATMTSLLSARVRVRGEDSDDVIEIKGRAEMAGVIARLAAARIKAPTEEVAVPVGVRTLRIDPDTIADAIDRARRGGLALNEAKGVFAEILVREAGRRLLERGVAQEELPRHVSELRAAREFRHLVDRAWPSLSGPQLIRSLFAGPTARAKAAADLVSPADADLLRRRSAGKIAEEPWTEADLPLLDEANAITTGGGRRFGHVVVDEAQDLSAMALRAAGRRAIGGSMTVLGDIAQSTRIGSQTSWENLASALGVDADQVRRRELTVGYRVPGPILDHANRLLALTAPDITPSSSIRSRGPGPEHHVVAESAIIGTVATLARDLVGDWSTIGVIADEARLDGLLLGLGAAGIDAGDTRIAPELDHAVSIVAPPTAKGLEFDVTMVVEPREIAARPNGLRLLYVALTRSVQRLLVVRAGAMPPPL